MKTYISLIFFSLFSCALLAQDTVVVQGFNYDSTTRDSLIQFPTSDHNAYEKILMYYSMRCKDGLVSTGTNRNRGCGEWDYSCNTNLVDSSRVDSLITAHPSFVIPGFAENIFKYTSQPVYTYYLRDLEKTTISSTSNEKVYPIGDGSDSSIALFGEQKVNKAFILYEAEELAANMDQNVSGLKFDFLGDLQGIDFLSIKLGNVLDASISMESIDPNQFTEVFNNHVGEADLEGTLYFKEDFDLEDGKDLLVQLTYTRSEEAPAMTMEATSTSNPSLAYHKGNDGYISINNSFIDLPVEGMETITDEVSVAFWSFGDANVLPKNTTIIYAVDDQNQRQLNVHLPWSNGQIFWDSGYEDGGYDRINKVVDPEDFSGKWSHWTFTKNASTGVMKIFLNGEQWHSGTSKSKPINISAFRIGGDLSARNPYVGDFDDLMIFDKALEAADIQKLMHNRPAETDDYYDALIRFFDFNEDEDRIAKDHSRFAKDGAFVNNARRRTFRGEEIFKDFTLSTSRPNISLVSGMYDRSTELITVMDSIESFPFEVIPYSIDGSDLVKESSLMYWLAGDTYVYDQNGEIYEFLEVEEEGRITIEEFYYYTKQPSRFELLSFVTPYGIGLDFGMEGRTWVFDVTDFGPVLKDKKRILMNRGGQWQEDIDIKFLFIKGTPTRNVLDIHQVWPVRSNPYARILDQSSLEPRTLPIEDEVKEMKLRVATTGHGQEGEFIQRSHFVELDGQREFQWQIWKECAFNPVYPQGGTWIYDRAGWCPGAPTDLREHEMMDIVSGQNEFELDYGLINASGTSNYIVNVQVAKYGEANFNLDANLERIMAPTDYIEDFRLNPTCTRPKLLVKNNGKEEIRSVRVLYGVEGVNPLTYTWTGNLPYLESTEITLPQLPNAQWSKGNTFLAEVTHVNGQEDAYQANNTAKSKFEQVPHLNGDIMISMLTNNAAQETRWTLKDESGNIIDSRTMNLAPNTRYIDTLTNLNGCYTLEVTDSGQDGISWWANNDGQGSIRVRGGGGSWTSLQSDFGGEITYAFTTGQVTNVETPILDAAQVNIYPNPSFGRYVVELEGLSEAHVSVFDQMGRRILLPVHYKLNATYDEVQIDLSDQFSGMYLIAIESDKGKIVRKVIKK